MTTLIVAVTRIRAWVSSATTRGSYHYTITAIESSININTFQRRYFFHNNVKHLKKRALYHDNTKCRRDQDSTLGFLDHIMGYQPLYDHGY
jgi:hypothetical protein